MIINYRIGERLNIKQHYLRLNVSLLHYIRLNLNCVDERTTTVPRNRLDNIIYRPSKPAGPSKAKNS